MQLVIDTAGVIREVDVNVQVPDATVGDLLEALGCRVGEGIVVDDRFLQAYLALAETRLHDSAVVWVGAGRERVPTSPARGPVSAVVGGVDAGQRVELRPGRTVVGPTGMLVDLLRMRQRSQPQARSCRRWHLRTLRQPPEPSPKARSGAWHRRNGRP
ncbi:MAG: hypothetical protein ACRDRW_13770 [Pseudonocardiaceae bacterium]